MRRNFISRILVLSILSFFYLGLFLPNTYAEGDKLPDCTLLKGQIVGEGWPDGATVDVACGGDNGGVCGGEVKKGLKAGDSFSLNTCSCPPYADGCLKVGQNLSLGEPYYDPPGISHIDVVGDVWQMPNGCTLGPSAYGYCAGNDGRREEDVPISCTVPTPACSTPCDPTYGDRDCEGTRDGCSVCRIPNGGSGFSCQPPPPGDTPPACNTSCNNPSACQGAQDGCTACVGGKCVPQPTPTPNITCNSTCTRDDECVGDARTRGCTRCVSNKCVPPPGVTPGPTTPPVPTKPPGTPVPSTPPACNKSCSRNADCDGAPARDGCTACIGNQCKVPSCNTTCERNADCAGAKDGCTVCGSGNKCQPAPTPTPIFNENWCMCDGLDTNPVSFFPGDNVSFISFGKVEAPYLTRAKVDSMSFQVYRGNATTATRIAESGAIPSVIESQSTAKNRYKSTWSYKIPTDIKKDEIFRVQSKIKCVAQNVLGASIKYQPSLIDRIVSFVGYLFGFRSEPAAMDYQSGSSPVPVSTSPSPEVLAAQQSLQIDTFTPAKIIEKSCSIIRFTFNN